MENFYLVQIIGMRRVCRLASVTLESVTKSFGNETVVDNVSFHADDGEFVVLLGPSGCGKTTTLRMISGLESVSSGKVLFDRAPVQQMQPDARNVGMVFQNYALYPHMTVADNLAFGMQSRKVPKSEISEAITRTAKLLEIDHLLTHKPRELSGGQRQRVALGRAIVREPRVFLMDEPLSNLDANLRERMRTELAQLHERLGITTFYVTHDQGEALTLSDKIIIMDKGSVRQMGTADDVYLRPNDTFVAQFIGSPGMNLWELDLGDPNGLGFCQGIGISTLPVLSAMINSKESILLGVRPEHLHLEKKDAGDMQIKVQVSNVERFGSHVQIHGKSADVHSFGVVAKLDQIGSCTKGDVLSLFCRLEDIHVFDGNSRKRIGGVL